ncbi:MAG: Na+/H+ antiporter NhaC [Halomonas sp.]|nr:Na+/H+ antiporter NhaC [Halomonas sp.]
MPLTRTHQRPAPPLAMAMTPLVVAIASITLMIYMFQGESLGGPVQLALIGSAALAAGLAMARGERFSVLKQGIFEGINVSMNAIIIILLVGGLIGVWILSGIVPSMIYYGSFLVSGDAFYFSACLICAIIAVSIGSSLTTAGTIGLALITIAESVGFSTAITAGAIVSGSYFGDKLSPLSDTTNLSAAVSGGELFRHIKAMSRTVFASLAISLVLYWIIGLLATGTSGNLERIVELRSLLDANFVISPLLLAPLIAVLILAYCKVDAIPTLFIGLMMGALAAVLWQSDNTLRLAAMSDNSMLPLVEGVVRSISNGYVATTGDAHFDRILSKGGMYGMLYMLWLVVAAMSFGGVMASSGFLGRLVETLTRHARTPGTLVLSTHLACLTTLLLTGSQYMGNILPGRMFKEKYEEFGLAPENLSRALEDASTVVSPLIPWTTCGAFLTATLGVPTLLYAPFAFFSLTNLMLALACALLGRNILRDIDARSLPTAGKRHREQPDHA